MAAKQLRGVGGVLGNLLTPPEAITPTSPEESPAAPPAQISEPQAEPVPVPVDEAPKAIARKPVAVERKKARLGRPPVGSRVTETIEREKVSLRLRSDLAAAYRDWSWEEHCQFSDLVDKALEFYLKSRGKARKPERE